MKDGLVPEFEVLDKLDKKELIGLVYKLESVMLTSIELNSKYSDALWHYEHIYDLKEWIMIKNNVLEKGEKYLNEVVHELENKYTEREPDDFKKEHNS